MHTEIKKEEVEKKRTVPAPPASEDRMVAINISQVSEMKL